MISNSTKRLLRLSKSFSSNNLITLPLFYSSIPSNPSVLLSQNKLIKSLYDDELFENVLSIYQKNRILGYPSDNYTYPFVIKACSVLGMARIGEGLHALVLKLGHVNNIIVQTSLVDFYGKCGCIGPARLVFDEIPQPDLVSWNSLITAYSLNGYHEEALEIFREICDTGLNPSVGTLANLVPVCTRSRYIFAGKSLHGFAVKCGYLVDQSLVPALISLYSSYGDLCIARSLFEHSEIRNITIWNAMISAYTQNQKPIEALEMFNNMLKAEMEPNIITYLSILPSCVHFGCIFYGESLHACLEKAGLVNHLSVLTSLLSMYGKAGEISASEFLFSQMRERNILSWNSLISAYIHDMQWDVSLAKFREMQIEGFKADTISIISILSACSELKATLLGKSAHGYSIRNGFDSNLNMSNSLLSFYSNCDQVSYSFKLFHSTDRKNIISWNTIISGCVHSGDTKSADVLLTQMQDEGMGFDLVTLISIIPNYDKPINLVQGMCIHSYALKIGSDADVSLSNALISMYFNCGDIDASELVFETLFNKSVVSWNAMITGYRIRNFYDKVMLYFYRMINEGHEPNYVTLLNVLPACDTLLQGKSIHAYASRRGGKLEAPLVTSLILMYARFHMTKYCLLLLEKGGKTNISLWNAVGSAHVQTHKAVEAVDFFIDLLQTETEPDYMTILSLISACAQLNSANLQISLLNYVIKAGFDHDVAITNALIDLYAKSGNILIARKLFDDLIEKDKISWGVMINGYGLNGDAEAVIDLVSKMELYNIKPDDITYLNIISACSHTGLVEQGRLAYNSMLNNGLLPRMEHYACIIDLLGRTGNVNEAYDIIKKMLNKPCVSLLESLLGACIVHGDLEIGEEIGRLLIDTDPENSGSYVMMHNVYASAGKWADADKIRLVMDDRRLRKVRGFSFVEGF